ncbi:hypothetical protein EMCG_08895 [[Emmonsia] crescens]|uniref:Uncharacterized protein n=1 Tax=[Emmonsia] crescens TaxID=73230 RepID=A0A0G2I4R2_9EURO|nr:hypothetical protein EMCG_08895 [Emmonsia crescens UAMH 3008]
MLGYKAVKTHLSLSTGHRDVNESSGVLQTLLGTTLGGLLLLLRLDLYHVKVSKSAKTVFQPHMSMYISRDPSHHHQINKRFLITRSQKVAFENQGWELKNWAKTDLGGLRLDFTRTGEGSVNFTHDVR